MDEFSWVEMTCPAGWRIENGFSREGREQFCAMRDGRYVRNRDGRVIWRPTETESRRLCWERWALETIAGRFDWDRDEDGDPVLRSDPMRLGLVTVEWGERHGYAACSTLYEVDPYEETHCHDPVEALARLAGIVVAWVGPFAGEQP